MKICVYGAGAVGGHIAGRLAAGGAEVSVIARGKQLDAIREHGLRVETRDGDAGLPPVSPPIGPAIWSRRTSSSSRSRRRALPAIAESRSHPCCTRTAWSLFVMNGIPWWYFHSHGGPWTAPTCHGSTRTGAVGAHPSGAHRRRGRLHRRQRRRARGDPRRERT